MDLDWEELDSFEKKQEWRKHYFGYQIRNYRKSVRSNPKKSGEQQVEKNYSVLDYMYFYIEVLHHLAAIIEIGFETKTAPQRHIWHQSIEVFKMLDAEKFLVANQEAKDKIEALNEMIQKDIAFLEATLVNRYTYLHLENLSRLIKNLLEVDTSGLDRSKLGVSR